MNYDPAVLTVSTVLERRMLVLLIERCFIL